MEKIISLYKITNSINGKVYIGQSVNPNRRWSDHKWLSKKDPEQFVHYAMHKYGIQNFIFEIIAESKNEIDANMSEIELINQYDSRNPEKGYNLAPGGDSPWNRGIHTGLQPMLNKNHTENSKQMMSVSHTGKILSEEHKKNISKGNIGKHNYSEEVISKIKKSSLGKKKSEETKRKMSETRTKMIGKNNPKTKLTEIQVLEIRRIYNEDKISQAKLAKMYDVSQCTIFNVLNNKYWC